MNLSIISTSFSEGFIILDPSTLKAKRFSSCKYQEDYSSELIFDGKEAFVRVTNSQKTNVIREFAVDLQSLVIPTLEGEFQHSSSNFSIVDFIRDRLFDDSEDWKDSLTLEEWNNVEELTQVY